MQFDDYVGSIFVDTSHMKNFVKSWFREDDFISVMGNIIGGYSTRLSFVISVEELLNISDKEFEDLTTITSDGRKVNLYFAVNPTKEDNTVSLYKRGGKENVREIYGCFVDFDVVHGEAKQGVFNSKDDIYSFLDSLEFPPSIIVDNGVNGGVHAYWRLVDEDTSKAEETLIARWWAYISAQSNVKIDRLIDKSRVARLPSGIYWPKDGEKFDMVRLVKSDGARYKLDDLLAISEKDAEAYSDRIDQIRAQRTQVDTKKWNDWLETKVKQSNPGLDRSLTTRQVRVLMHMIEQHVNNNYQWCDILEPYGWSFFKEQSDGAVQWCRPGKHGEKSAVVDHVYEDGSMASAMSLLSSSEETGLYDLKEAGIHITKKQALLRFKYNDDVVAMANDMYSEVMDV